jgi:hypothetical protein
VKNTDGTTHNRDGWDQICAGCLHPITTGEEKLTSVWSYGRRQAVHIHDHSMCHDMAGPYPVEVARLKLFYRTNNVPARPPLAADTRAAGDDRTRA